MSNPIALRVARRYRAGAAVAPSKRLRVEFGDGGRISAAELRQMLEPDLGPLERVRFLRSPNDPANIVVWEAVAQDTKAVTGRLIFHAAVAEDQVVTWAEVVLDQAAWL